MSPLVGLEINCLLHAFLLVYPKGTQWTREQATQPADAMVKQCQCFRMDLSRRQTSQTFHLGAVLNKLFKCSPT